MSSVTIIGTGNVGSAIAELAAKAGASVQVLGRDAVKAAEVAAAVGGVSRIVGSAATGDIVVLAVPYPALAEIAGQYGAGFDGKILVDVTNPVDFATFDDLVVPADASAAAELQAALPGAKVLKAFNTNLVGTIAAGTVGDVATTVLVAGDDPEARQALVDLVTAGGLAAASVGALKRARELEALAFLQMTLAAQGVTSWGGGFALRK